MTQHVQRSISFGEALVSLALRTLPIKHGKHRLLDKIGRPFGNHLPKHVRMNFRGRSLEMDCSDLVGYHFLILKSFDPEVSEVLCAFSSEDDVFWDVGANKGTCSYEIATSLPSCKIVAIEPQHLLAELTRRNLQSLAPGRFEVYQLGIGTREETLTLNVPRDNRGRASFLPENFSEGSEKQTVQVKTAAQVESRSAFGFPTLVKIDVEGYEEYVIESLNPAISAGRCRAIVFENHPDKEDSFRSIHDIARNNAYQIFRIEKTLFSTRLRPANTVSAAATDYCMVREDLCSRALERFP